MVGDLKCNTSWDDSGRATHNYTPRTVRERRGGGRFRMRHFDGIQEVGGGVEGGGWKFLRVGT